MCSKRKVWAAVLLMTAFCVSSLAAQISSFSSNTSEVTEGLFTSEVDKFLDVNSWQDLEFNKFFTTIQVRGVDGIGAGFAKKAGPVYLGFGYFGKFWTGGINSETKEYGDNYATNAWRGKKTVNKNYLSDSGLSWINQVDFLLGTKAVGGILLDLSFLGSGRDTDDVDSPPDAGGNVSTAKSSIKLGIVEAGLGWGKNFDLGGGFVLKPNLGFTYNIDLRKTVAGSGSAETTTLTGVDSFFTDSAYSNVNNGMVGLKGYLTGYAGLTADLSKNTTDGSLWLGYNLKYNFYDRQIKTGSGAWTDFDPSYMNHSINLGVGAWYALDRKLSLGWSVEGTFELTNAKITSALTSVWAGMGRSPDHKYTDIIFGFIPKAAFGVVYKPVPDRFNFNGSIALYPIGDGFIHRKLTHSDISGVAVTTTEKNNRVNATYAATSLGFTWFIIEKLSLDAGVTALTNGSRVNLTQFSALLSYKM